MRASLLNGTLAFLLVSIAPMTAAAGDGAEIGRYQLASGSYSFLGIDGIERQSQGLFRIDTATGEIYECAGTAFDGRSVNKPGKIVSQKGCTPFEHNSVFDKSSIRE